ncbi:hypothetical protein MMC29_000026 [Sticta canariensis]|nr:hypothetical protein [Sticta canariensis]
MQRSVHSGQCQHRPRPGEGMRRALSQVPIAAEVLKSLNVYDKNRLMGVTTLDVVRILQHTCLLATTAVTPLQLRACNSESQWQQADQVLQAVRARTFYAEKVGAPVAEVDVPVIGGHAGKTILPLFSQASPGHSLPEDVIAALTQRTQDGGTEVVTAKAGKVCSFTLDSRLHFRYRFRWQNLTAGWLQAAGPYEGLECATLQACQGLQTHKSCCVMEHASSLLPWITVEGVSQGSATLSMAYAGALFGDACLRALNGEPDVAEYAYVDSDVVSGLSFFSTKVKLGPDGIREIQPYGTMNDVEKKALDECVPELKSSISKGVDFAHGKF